MSRILVILCFSLICLNGCGGAVEYGVVDRGGVLYPLCEKSKWRITDVYRISFELPIIFKRAPCSNFPDYSYDLRTDSLYVTIPAAIEIGSQVLVGGVYSMSFHGGHARNEYYLLPEVFFDDHAEYLSKRSRSARLVTAAWVGWQNDRCARFYSEGDKEGYVLRVLDYFCWESISGSSFPIHVSVSQKQPPGIAPVNLDKEFIEPVLASMTINPVPAERLALWESYRMEFCANLKRRYDEKIGIRKMVDGPDFHRTIMFLRACGYQAPDPVGIEDWAALFKPGGRLIGREGGESDLRKVTPEQFAELESKLMSLQLVPARRPESTIYGISRDGDALVEKLRVTGPYSGVWYKVPPYYSNSEGIGLRDDPVYGRTIDVYLKSDVPPWLRIVSQ